MNRHNTQKNTGGFASVVVLIILVVSIAVIVINLHIPTRLISMAQTTACEPPKAENLALGLPCSDYHALCKGNPNDYRCQGSWWQVGNTSSGNSSAQLPADANYYVACTTSQNCEWVSNDNQTPLQTIIVAPDLPNDITGITCGSDSCTIASDANYYLTCPQDSCQWIKKTTNESPPLDAISVVVLPPPADTNFANHYLHRDHANIATNTPDNNCPIPTGTITCGSFADPINPTDNGQGLLTICGHCNDDTDYPTNDPQCTQFPSGTKDAIDVVGEPGDPAAAPGTPIILPDIDNNPLNWRFLRQTGSISNEGVITAYTGTDIVTGATYYLQLHHTQPDPGYNTGNYTGKTVNLNDPASSGQIGAYICDTCTHIHIQLASGSDIGLTANDTPWLDASQYFCRNNTAYSRFDH